MLYVKEKEKKSRKEREKERERLEQLILLSQPPPLHWQSKYQTTKVSLLKVCSYIYIYIIRVDGNLPP